MRPSCSDEPMSGDVEFLLSTYNGEQVLPSCPRAYEPRSTLTSGRRSRDDGSRDGTVDLLEQLMSRSRRDRLSVGTNLGAGRSFMSLLRGVSPEADYAAFCDQDDVWLPEELSSPSRPCRTSKAPACTAVPMRLVSGSLSDIKVHRRCVRGRHSRTPW